MAGILLQSLLAKNTTKESDMSPSLFLLRFKLYMLLFADGIIIIYLLESWCHIDSYFLFMKAYKIIPYLIKKLVILNSEKDNIIFK